MKIKLALLAGGNSTEREVSILSANEMLRNLDNEKYDVNVLSINDDNAEEWVSALLRDRPDAALIALHGGLGENGSLQGLLQCLGIPYVGSKALGSAIGMDKALSKLIMRAYHVPVAEDVFIRRWEQWEEYEENIRKLGYPLVVKPNNGGSSIGVAIVNDRDELAKAVEGIKKLKDDILIEKFLAGQEVTCGIIENEDGLEVLTVLDIDATNDFYDYDAKYINDMTKIEFSSLPDYLQRTIQEIAKKVFLALRCSGYGRVDMIVREEQIYVLEINTLPGMTSHSLIPKAALGKDISYGQLLDWLIDYELKSQNNK